MSASLFIKVRKTLGGLLIASWIFCACPAQGTSSPEWLSVHKAVGDSLGVQIGAWRQTPGKARPWEATPEDLDRIKAAGFGYVRSGVDWLEVEPVLGQFEWANLDDFLDAIRVRNLKLVFVLGGGHPAFAKRIEGARYEQYRPPVTQEAVQAFAHFTAEVVRRHDNENIVWEIWNEPDSDWKPWPDPDAYAALASAACSAIRQVAPSAKIVGPAFANFPALAKDSLWSWRHRNFIATLVRSPAGTCLNAISIHAYRPDSGPPESALDDFEGARQFLTSHTPKGQKVLPLISTEWGYSSLKVTEQEQAAYALRSPLIALLGGATVSIWYEWRNSPRASDDPESYYGLLGVAGENKPAFSALQSLLPRIRDAVIERRIPMADPDHFVLLIEWPDGRLGLLAWTVKDSSQKTYLLQVQGRHGQNSYPLSGQPLLVDDVTDLGSTIIMRVPQGQESLEEEKK